MINEKLVNAGLKYIATQNRPLWLSYNRAYIVFLLVEKCVKEMEVAPSYKELLDRCCFNKVILSKTRTDYILMDFINKNCQGIIGRTIEGDNLTTFHFSSTQDATIFKLTFG